MITVIGIGNDKGDMTSKARSAIRRADYVTVRSNQTKAGKHIRADESFDILYDTADNFDELNLHIAARLHELDNEYGNVVYCVDGDGYADTSVMAAALGGEINIIAGVSKGVRCPDTAVLSMSAYDLDRKLLIDSAAGVLVTDIDSPEKAGDVKLMLLGYHDCRTKCVYTQGGKSKSIDLEELDRMRKYDYTSAVYVPSAPSIDKSVYCLGDLVRILQRLTAPDGCPWDKVQTHDSILINLIEEAYEVVDAFIKDDIDGEIEELGDVLLQSVFHCNIAERSGEFTLSDVVSELCTKLYTRHTHIFGKDHANDSDQALDYWEKAKSVEKSFVSVSDQIARYSQTFSSALRVQKLIKKIAKQSEANFGADDLLERIYSLAGTDKLGELAFYAIAYVALKGVDVEVELRRIADKFKQNYADLEGKGEFTLGDLEK